MSPTIDERVVEMRFNNQQFENGVRTSMSTIDKLKQSLNFGDSAKGLENIGAAANGVRMDGLGSAIETVKAKFSALEVMAITALANITNSAVNAGVSLVKSLSVDNIAAGWSKFGEKTTSVGTLISQGYDIQTVTEQLERLNWFTDETSYNFTDMVANIAKFTASGKDLTSSVTALEGIANWAALSGQNATTASRAMYQLSQAMGAGVMRKEDYKSIQNVSMDTDEFRQKALDAAVALGTLKKNADGTYQSLVAKTKAFDKAQFAEHLTQDAWFTSDVMMKVFNEYSGAVDQIYEYAEEKGITASEAIQQLGGSLDQFGLKAFKAAQEARTWGDVVDSVKDAVSTGWMTTFELIFGNYEQAKKLWTDLANELYDVFAEGGNARNELLKEWNKSGGRIVLLDAFWNSFNALRDIIENVKEAFHDIFPPKTAADLLEFTKKLRDLTKHFELSEETATNLHNTFRGFFAVIDIGLQIISALWNGLKKLLGFMPSLGGGILKVTGNIGDWLASLDALLKENQTFQKVVDGVVTFIQSIPGKIDEVFQKLTGISIGDAFESLKKKASELLEKLKEIFGGFNEIDTSPLDSFTEKLKKRFEPLSAIFEGVKKVLSAIWQFFKKMAPVFATLATALGKALGSVGEAISKAISGADFDGLLDLVNGGVLVAIGVGLKKLIDTFTKLTDNAGGILDGITGILNGAKGCFESWQKDIKANILKKIAVAVALLTASLVALSLIDSEKMSVALMAMTSEFIALVSAVKVLSTTMSGKNARGMTQATTSMILMSTAILILSAAVKNLADLDWDGVLKGVVGIAALAEILVQVAKQLSDNTKHLLKGALGLIGIAEAIRLLVEPTKELGAMSWEELKKGLISVGVLCAELALFLKTSDLDNMSLGKGLGLMALAEAVNILAISVAKFGEMDTTAMIQGLAGIGVVLAELAVFTKLTGDSKKVISTATGMVILGAAMLIFANALEDMGSMSIEEIGKGLLAMGGSLAIVAAAMKVMPATTPIIAAGLVLVGAALKIIGSTLADFSGMSWEEIARGLVTLAGSLGIIAGAMYLMEGALPGAAAMLVMAAALAIFTPALKAMAGMTWEEIGKGMVVLAGAFTVIGVAGLVLAPIVPAILALAAAIALLGVGATACGVGVLALSAGLAALSVTGAAGITTLVLAVEALLSLIPSFAMKVGEGLVALIVAIGNAAPDIAIAVIQIVTAALTALNETVPQIVETVITLVEFLLITLAEHLPAIVQAGMDILIALLEGIRNNIREIVVLAYDIVVEFIEGIAEKIPDLIQAGIDLIISFVDGLAQGIDDNAERLRDAFVHLFEAAVNAVLTFLGINSPSKTFLEIGVNAIKGFIEGIGQTLKDLLAKIGEVLTAVINAIKDKFKQFVEKGKEIILKIKEGISNKLSEIRNKVSEVITNLVSAVKEKAIQFMQKGQELMTNLKTGITNKITEIKNAAKDLVAKALTAIKEKVEEWKNIGSKLIDGLKEGIKNAASRVVNAAKDVVNGAIEGAKKLLGIHSPSRVFAEIGKFADEGFAKGLHSYASEVVHASQDVGKEAINGMADAIANVADVIENGVDSEPTIRPVLDLSQVMAGVNSIDDMLNTSRSVDLAARNSSDMNHRSNTVDEEAHLISDLRSIVEDALKNQNGGITNTFNITGDNPREIADEVSRIIQKQIERRDASWA